MRSLAMSPSSGQSYKSKFPVRPKSTVWMIYPEDFGQRHLVPTYPSDERILALAKEHIPSAVMEIFGRPAHHRAVVVRLPVGTQRSERIGFLKALSQETTHAG